MKTFLVSLSLFLIALPVCASPIRGITVYNAVNQERGGSQLRTLVPDATLIALAQKKADDMESKNYFAHTDPKGVSILRSYFRSQTRYKSLGENLAMNFGSTESLVSAWMNSPTHRSNILEGQYKYTGIAISKSGKYIVQYFGR